MNEIRSAMGGYLFQSADSPLGVESLKTVTNTPVPRDRLDDISFAWTVAKHARSNAIAIGNRGVLVGLGAGHVSRVDAVQTALKKARAFPEALKGSVLASDAFFPFRDNIDSLKDSGISIIVQPGGSVRDEEVIAACNEQGIAMAFTGQRHFRH
jgi:phosphoribosylaminoimidazolecarboxamide formyltransferase/IMP cyclohydrolase